MNRRNFFGALAALPLVGKLVKPPPPKTGPIKWPMAWPRLPVDGDFRLLSPSVLSGAYNVEITGLDGWLPSNPRDYIFSRGDSWE